MTYQSVHTGPEVDAAVTVLDDVQEIRTEVEGYKNTVVSLAGQVQTDAGNAAADALTASQAASDALDSKNAAYASEQAASGHASNADSARAQAVVARNGAEDALGEALDAESRMVELLSDSGPTVDELRAAIRRINYGDGPYPSLGLNFVGATMLGPRVEFTRASSATYFDAMGVLQTAQPNEPRFDYDPITGKSLGLLVEGQATNLLLWSEDFTQGKSLVRSGLDIISTSTPIEGLSEAAYVYGIDDTNYNAVRDTSSISDPEIYSHYAFVKDAGAGFAFIQHRISQYSAVFDLSSAEIVFQNETLSNVYIEPLSGGWFKIGASFLNDPEETFRHTYVGPSIDGSLGGYDDPGRGILVAAFQKEKAPTPTSYIKTEASQVTRAADNVSMPTSEFPYNPLEGTILIKLEVRKGLVNNPNAWCASNSQNLRAEFGGTNLRLTLDLRAVGHSLTATGLYGKGGNNILAVSFRDGEILLGLNGNTAAIQIEGNIGPYIEGLNLGRRTTSNYINSTIDNFTFFPRAFSETQLIALTS